MGPELAEGLAERSRGHGVGLVVGTEHCRRRLGEAGDRWRQ
ncbi:hypothetical protein AvCA_05700 [Azotobacter vinelandii CA]|uniref:Uncharacterized protein n=2 Tax=Azotobacter vinelandii TaxID=354 RepID=C1DKG0_AZOVD|nr:hypothetical protein Avin_05700 [Azotobacter vinelandii DJ]AGK15573.1 hypothetical protein AvCA_05700 [Azotobacter vinelandii CA]AGK19394.1 hypothetical protein AvCA6_05700 [Azotobacter vinelandii CA6]